MYLKIYSCRQLGQCVGIAAALLMCAMSGAVYAQTENAALRPMPVEMQPQDINFKSFRLRPALEIVESYNDNIYGTKTNTSSDYITSINPSLHIAKDYGRSSWQVHAFGNINRYWENGAENTNNFGVNFSGLFDANSRWKFPYTLGYTQRYKSRKDPLQAAGTITEPLKISSTVATAGAVRRFNRLTVGLIGKYNHFAFEDGVLQQDAATPLILSDNNRSSLEGALEFKYDFLRGDNPVEEPEHFLYTNIRYGHQDFEKRSHINGGFNGLKRDRDTFGVMAGFQTNYKQILIAKLGAGYLHQSFEEDSLDSTGNIDFEADIHYLPFPKLVLGLNVSRDIMQDNDLIRGIVNTTYGASANYELLHNLYLLADLKYITNSFEIVDGREDKNYFGQIGIDYILGPRLRLGADISHLIRDSSNPLRELDNSIISVRVKGNL